MLLEFRSILLFPHTQKEASILCNLSILGEGVEKRMNLNLLELAHRATNLSWSPA